MTYILQDHQTIGNKYIAHLRCVDHQADRAKFRYNLRRLSTLLGYEISRTLSYEAASIETPLGIADTTLPSDRLVLASILRAGLPMQEGLLDVFDDADCAFASSYRKHHKDGSFEINMPYVTCPDLTGAVLVLADPMLATGASIDTCLKAFAEYGTPKAIHVVTAIASQFGLSYIKRHHPKVKLWIGAVDEELTAKSYIVPGLGDAGDLAFGPKMQD